jgi:hypothetical protein
MKRSDANIRKMLKSIIIVISLILIAFTTDQQALGYSNESNQKEYLDFQPYTGNRLMVFNDTNSNLAR